MLFINLRFWFFELLFIFFCRVNLPQTLQWCWKQEEIKSKTKTYISAPVRGEKKKKKKIEQPITDDMKNIQCSKENNNTKKKVTNSKKERKQVLNDFFSLFLLGDSWTWTVSDKLHTTPPDRLVPMTDVLKERTRIKRRSEVRNELFDFCSKAKLKKEQPDKWVHRMRFKRNKRPGKETKQQSDRCVGLINAWTRAQ